jgi:hypothetical protein
MKWVQTSLLCDGQIYIKELDCVVCAIKILLKDKIYTQLALVRVLERRETRPDHPYFRTPRIFSGDDCIAVGYLD